MEYKFFSSKKSFFTLQCYGNEWALFKLGHLGEISKVNIDTTHFKGNYPHNVKIEGALVYSGKNLKNAIWQTILPPKKVKLKRI